METKIYCLMCSGTPLTPLMCEILFVSALRMWREGEPRSFIETPKHRGVIESELEIIEYLGIPAIPFKAMIATEDWKGTQVRFVVRVEALEESTESTEHTWAVGEIQASPRPPRHPYDVNPSMN